MKAEVSEADILSQNFKQAIRLMEAEKFVRARALLESFTERLCAVSQAVSFGEKIERPEISVIVVSYQHGPNVERGLAEIASQVRGRSVEIILVNNGNDALFASADRLIKNFTGVRAPFPAGASSGRNLGAFFSSAPLLLFLDDDGVMAPGCIDAMRSALESTHAVAARGRVRPLSGPQYDAAHYDLGDHMCRTIINIEGLAIWRREAFIASGGYDPLLYGHEGIDLCTRVWRFYGPGAFIYQPDAILYHDFVDDIKKIEIKKARHSRNKKYIDTFNPSCSVIVEGTRAWASNSRNLQLSLETLKPSPHCHNPEQVSIITTARNAENFLDEFSRCWKSQDQKDFEIIFIDDGSQDQTINTISKLWKGDNRLKLIGRPFSGRGASLNAAVNLAANDICLIADADDLSVPSRISRTQAFFQENNTADCVSFIAFEESNNFLSPRPHSPCLTDLNVRCLFGMPVSFSTFAFRKSKLRSKFDESLNGGIDCDWLLKNFQANSNFSGKYIFSPVTYYRRHVSQITRNYTTSQELSRVKFSHFAFERILGPLSDADKNFIDILIEKRNATYDEKQYLAAWIINLINRNENENVYDSLQLRIAISDAFNETKIIGAQSVAKANSISKNLLNSARSLKKGDYKSSRKALRKALKLVLTTKLRHLLPLRRL